jgi:hypothetical protein
MGTEIEIPNDVAKMLPTLLCTLRSSFIGTVVMRNADSENE